MIMSNDEMKVFNRQLEQEVDYLNYLVEKIGNNKLENEQFVLDFLDKINKLSVTY